MSKVKVSVIIPVYNRESYIPQCMESILTQTLDEIEVICVDDGSTDGTLSILNSFSEKDERVVIFTQNRQGPGKARNAGIELAKGKYLAFMDSDDYYPSKGVLEVLYKAAEKYGVEMSGGSMLRDVNGEISPFDELCFKNDQIYKNGEWIDQRGFTRFLFKKKFIVEKGICFPNYRQHEDPVFMLNAVMQSHEIWTTCEYVYVYREFDKMVDYVSLFVIADIINGYRDLLMIASMYYLVDYQERVVDTILNKWGILISWMILNDDGFVLSKISSLSSLVISNVTRQKYEKYWLIEQIVNRVENHIKMEELYMDKIHSSDGIVIYGSGSVGKTVFDMIKRYGVDKKIIFAVSSVNREAMLRGVEVKSIYDIDNKDRGILIIIAKKGDQNEMLQTATNLGFTNILQIDNKVYGLSKMVINRNEYAY